jgi:hypothetical protein
MPTKPLDRLMFAQGGLCYFCSDPLPKAQASIEHLVPLARAGSNSDDNCVACCKAINGLLGSMSLKEKIKVVLNQKGNFICPNRQDEAIERPISAASLPSPRPAAALPPQPLTAPTKTGPAPAPTVKKSAPNEVPAETIAIVLKTLKNLGHARPRRIKTLTSTMKAFHKIKLSDKQIAELIEHFRSSGKIVVTGLQVTYKL